MNRHLLPIALASLAIGLASALGAAPNIVVIMADDLGYGDTSIYGDGWVETPSLERMAAGGLTFTDFHASIDFINANKDHPFFLLVAHEAVHLPFQTPEDTPENHQPAPEEGHWKLIVKGDKVELYNLADDIGERNNIAAEHPDRTAAMTAAINTWKASVVPGS